METPGIVGIVLLILGIIVAIIIAAVPAYLYVAAWLGAVLLIIGGIVETAIGR